VLKFEAAPASMLTAPPASILTTPVVVPAFISIPPATSDAVSVTASAAASAPVRTTELVVADRFRSPAAEATVDVDGVMLMVSVPSVAVITAASSILTALVPAPITWNSPPDPPELSTIKLPPPVASTDKSKVDIPIALEAVNTLPPPIFIEFPSAPTVVPSPLVSSSASIASRTACSVGKLVSKPGSPIVVTISVTCCPPPKLRLASKSAS